MGDNSMLHIIIFDEMDAIMKTRGSTHDSTGVSDSIVNQLLSKIDGVDALNNILIIGKGFFRYLMLFLLLFLCVLFILLGTFSNLEYMYLLKFALILTLSYCFIHLYTLTPYPSIPLH